MIGLILIPTSPAILILAALAGHMKAPSVLMSLRLALRTFFYIMRKSP